MKMITTTIRSAGLRRNVGSICETSQKIMPRGIVPRSLWRHYKGKVYKILATCTHTETLQKLVVYKEVRSSVLWARPRDMFLEKVEEEEYRFKKIS